MSRLFVNTEERKEVVGELETEMEGDGQESEQEEWESDIMWDLIKPSPSPSPVSSSPSNPAVPKFEDFGSNMSLVSCSDNQHNSQTNWSQYKNGIRNRIL